MNETQNIRVLLIEDDAVDREAISRYLYKEKLPYQLTTACTEKEALAALKIGEQDIVILDYNLKTTTGLELLPYTNLVPVIFVTGGGNEQIAVEAMHHGVSDYLVKDPNGYYLTRIPIAIRNVLEQKKTEDALKKAHALLEHRVEERTAELKAANQKLEQEIHEREKSEARLNTFLNSATEAFFLLDAQLNFVDINKLGLETLQIEKHQVVGTPVATIIPDIYTSGRHRLYQEVLSTGEPVTIEDFVLQTHTGPRTGIIKAFKVDDMLGIILIDTTRRKKLEEQLRQAQKMEAIGSLAGGIAHDFNNILGIIIGYTELAMDDIQNDSRAWENIQQVMAAATRGQEIIKQILAFSRKEESEYKPIDLKNLLDESLKLLHPNLPASIKIVTRIQDKLHPILADVTQIHQVIQNICTNAAQAMRENGGELQISLEEFQQGPDDLAQVNLEQGIYQRLSFCDTGHGIKPEFIRRVFDPYFTTKLQGEGSGLGLAVVYGILRNHRGDITIQSEQGQGTCIQIYLPIINGPQ